MVYGVCSQTYTGIELACPTRLYPICVRSKAHALIGCRTRGMLTGQSSIDQAGVEHQIFFWIAVAEFMGQNWNEMQRRDAAKFSRT